MNGILYINKPAGMTSFDVVHQVRKAYGIKSVGHTGTLDPQATGLLVVLVGKATKLTPYLLHQQKEYIAECTLGIKTDTGDIWGSVKEEKEASSFTNEELSAVLSSFMGKSLQLPPMVSALKVNGKKLYEYARDNIEIERQPRPIEIFDIELLGKEPFRFRVRCSAGTYIRTLCEDIAEKLGTVGTMSALERSMIGSVDLSQAMDLSKAVTEKPAPLKQLDIIEKSYETIEAADVKAVKDGKPLHCHAEQDTIMVIHERELLACYTRVKEDLFRCQRGLW